MPDSLTDVAELAPPADAKRARASAIYTTWRNAYINNLPVEAFARVEAASRHLIDAIADVL